MLLLKALGVWVVLAVVGFFNGVARGALLTWWLGDDAARRVSSVTASAFIFLVALAFAPAFAGLNTRELLAVGVLWLLLTVAFEFALGRLSGQPWATMLEDYNLLKGRLWLLVLLTVLFSPLATAKLRGLA